MTALKNAAERGRKVYLAAREEPALDVADAKNYNQMLLGMSHASRQSGLAAIPSIASESERITAERFDFEGWSRKLFFAGMAMGALAAFIHLKLALIVVFVATFSSTALAFLGLGKPGDGRATSASGRSRN